MLWPYPYFREPMNQKAYKVHSLLEILLQCPLLTSPQGAPRDTDQEVGKDREDTSEFKASASEPHTAPAEH